MDSQLVRKWFFLISKDHSSCHPTLYPGSCYCQEIAFTETKQGRPLSPLKMNIVLYSLTNAIRHETQTRYHYYKGEKQHNIETGTIDVVKVE